MEPSMSRPFIPSAVLTVLALAGQVRPRFMDDWPQLSEANLISRAGMVTAQLSKECRCAHRECL